jgi:adenosyl cobinamide kinase/adenosyl cobinamide phosphate guanylyltransferase
MPLTLLLGGAASGKSRTAVRLARSWPGPVVIVATAEERDEEMREKIRRHREHRPEDWVVVEAPLDLTGAIASVPDDAFAIVDCLTLWASNLLEAGLHPEAILRRASEAAELAAARPAPTVVVSNEVGSGIVPANALARRYRDVLGRINAVWAEAAETALLLVAGRALPLSDPAELPLQGASDPPAGDMDVRGGR